MKIYKFDNKILALNNKWFGYTPYVPPIDPNPLGLPALTIRVKVAYGSPSVSYATVTAVQGQTDVYDICTSTTSRTTDWSGLLYNNNITEVLGANAADVDDMSEMFNNCYSLTSVQYFDTSSVIYMNEMFKYCTSLTAIPLFNTSSVTNVNQMLYSCINVESGALALYQQMSTQANPPSSHSGTFYNCGSNTTSGAAELAQIPSDWK